tara:strand:+ start:2706 stop:4424 length:1719 start_codon:yes stop_codon:yes gene_type:complete
MGTIIIKTEGSGDTASTEPATLTKGELAVNTQGGLLFHGNDSGATARFKATTLAGTNYSLFTVSGGKVVEIGAGTEDYVLTSNGTGAIPSWQAAGGSSATNLSGTTHASQYTVNSSSGNNVTIAEASGSIAGVMTVAHHDKLDGIEASATADQTKSDIEGLAIQTTGAITSGSWTATDIAVAHGGTGASSASSARTNLGLGTISTQAANSVNIDGGAIDAVTIGTNSVVTELRVDNLKMGSSTNRIESTNTDGDIELYTESGGGKVVIAGSFQINESTAVSEIENSDSLGTSDTKLCTQGNVKAYVDGLTSHSNLKLDNLAATDDNTDLDATTSAHGLLPKLGGGTTNFLRADGSWAAPSGGGGGTVNTADIADVSVTQTELAELETIGSTTISSTQWGYVGGADQALTTSSNANFNRVITNGSYFQTRGSGDAQFYFQAGYPSAGNYDKWYMAVENVSGDPGHFSWYSKGTGSYVEVMDLDSSGNLQIDGELDAASLDISGNVDIDGTCEADAYSANGTSGVTTSASDHATVVTNVTFVPGDPFLGTPDSIQQSKERLEFTSGILTRQQPL